MTPRRRLRALVVVAGLAGFALFVVLGSWQVQRRAWKLELIERVTARIDAAPAAAPAPADWPGIDRASAEYRRIEVSGRWQHDREALVLAATAVGAGHWVVTPLTTADGWTVLVNRGFVDAAHRDPQTRPAPAQEAVVGVLRISEPDGGFLRDNDPANDRWFSRDVAAIANARGLGAVAPYFIDAGTPHKSLGDGDLPIATPTQWPVPGLTVIRFRNHHLVYALTWYTLALMVAGAVGYALRRRPAQHSAAAPSGQ